MTRRTRTTKGYKKKLKARLFAFVFANVGGGFFGFLCAKCKLRLRSTYFSVYNGLIIIEHCMLTFKPSSFFFNSFSPKYAYTRTFPPRRDFPTGVTGWLNG